MYLKIIGCMFVLTAAAVIGFLKAEELKMRVKRLEAFKRMMMFLQGELRFHRATLSEAFENVAKRVETPFDQFLGEMAIRLEKHKEGDFDKVWQELSKKLLLKSGFQKEDAQLMELLRSSLGYLDLTMQTETLNLAMVQTETAIHSARKQQEIRGKLYRTMGVTVGALLVLLII